MKIKRQLETSSAKYNLEDLSDRQFHFLMSAIQHYCYYTMRSLPEESEGDPFAELYHKMLKMRESQITTIN